MQISDEKKVDILLLALKERYESIHKIRERVQSIGIWTLGIFLTATGWVFQTDNNLERIEVAMILVTVIVAMSILRLSYLADLEVGFKSQQRAAVKIEKALCLYEKKFFSQEDESVYEEGWKKSGQNGSSGKFFKTTTLLIIIGAIIFVSTVLIKATTAYSKGQKCHHSKPHFYQNSFR